MQVTSDFSNLKSYKPPLKREPIFPPAKLQGPSQDEVTVSRLKKTLSECRYAVLAAGILFFAVRRNIRKNDAIDLAIEKRKYANIIRNKKLEEQAKKIIRR